MTGDGKARNYLNAQKLYSDIFLSSFYKSLEKFNKKGRYLEIGAGPGYQTARVFEKFKPDEIVVVEPSSSMISMADEYLTKKGFSSKVKLKIGYVEDEQLMGSLGKFDLIYSTISLHHWGDPAQAFRNLVKQLKPDGMIVIHDFRRINLPFHFSLHADSHRAFSSEELAELLSQVGIHRYELASSLLFHILTIRSDQTPSTINRNPLEKTLDKVNTECEAAIVSISPNCECSLELRQSGIVPTARVKILEHDPYHILCKVDQRTIVIDRDTASGIITRVF